MIELKMMKFKVSKSKIEVESMQVAILGVFQKHCPNAGYPQPAPMIKYNKQMQTTIKIAISRTFCKC